MILLMLILGGVWYVVYVVGFGCLLCNVLGVSYGFNVCGSVLVVFWWKVMCNGVYYYWFGFLMGKICLFLLN